MQLQQLQMKDTPAVKNEYKSNHSTGAIRIVFIKFSGYYRTQLGSVKYFVIGSVYYDQRFESSFSFLETLCASK